MEVGLMILPAFCIAIASFPDPCDAAAGVAADWVGPGACSSGSMTLLGVGWDAVGVGVEDVVGEEGN